ncbi:MAG: response regulator [Verrucomicrobiota bacterium]
MTAETDYYKVYKILYVDDETNSLKYFNRYFNTKFQVTTAETADEALEILAEAQGDYALVMSDQRMPGMQGVDFLAEVRREYPKIVRILTTAYADLESAMDSVNKGYVYRYVVKPWNLPELEMVLKQCFDYYRLLQERESLIYEKLSVNQRFLIANRVHCLGLVTAAQGGTWEFAELALADYVKDIPRGIEKACQEFAIDKSKDILRGGSMLQSEERAPLLHLARDLSTFIQEIKLGDKEEVDFSVWIKELQTTAKLQIDLDLADQLPSLSIGKACLETVLQDLSELVSKHGDGRAHLKGAVGQDPHLGNVVKLVLSCKSSSLWSSYNLIELYALLLKDEGWESGLKLFRAYLGVYAHGGVIHRVHDEEVCGVEMKIPLNIKDKARSTAKDAVDLLLATFAKWDARG